MLDDRVFLYVEDDPHSRTVMRLLLTKSLHVKKLTIFEDSQNFEVRINELEHVPDVILLDIQVPPLDGFEMIKIIRQAPKFESTKVIALTASVMNEEVEKLRAAGFDGTISKPLRMVAFPDQIRRIVKGESVWSIA